MGPFGPLDYKEYTIIQTPKGPIILINPQLLQRPSWISKRTASAATVSHQVPAAWFAVVLSVDRQLCV